MVSTFPRALGILLVVILNPHISVLSLILMPAVFFQNVLFLPFNTPSNFLLKLGLDITSDRYWGVQHFGVRLKATHDVSG